jgi:hypothetical protein
MRIFRRSVDPTEDVLRRLSRQLRWFRPSVDDAPTPNQQLEHLARHRLCPAIEQGDPAPVMTALAITEEALARTDLDDALRDALTLGLVEVLSDWCSWPETPPEVVATIEAGMGPLTRARWNSIREQGAAVAAWIRGGGAPERTEVTVAECREIENAELRFLVRSSRQYVDETMTVGTADRVRFEMATGQGV